jgi:Spy/CpxP family protein refolding chaperone
MFRAVIIAFLFLNLAFPAMAQGPGGKHLNQTPGQFPGLERGQRPENGFFLQGRSLERIQKALNLTADQMSSLQALIDSRRSNWEALAQEMRQNMGVLRDLQQQPNPNPTDLGNAMLALRSTREKIKIAQDEFYTMFSNLLTTDQKTTLDGIKNRLGKMGGFRGRR